MWLDYIPHISSTDRPFYMNGESAYLYSGFWLRSPQPTYKGTLEPKTAVGFPFMGLIGEENSAIPRLLNSEEMSKLKDIFKVINDGLKMDNTGDEEHHLQGYSWEHYGIV